MSPLDKFDWILRFLRYCLMFCGFNFFDGDYSNTYATYAFGLMVFVGSLSCVYSIAIASVEDAILTAVLGCLASQGTVKYVATYYNRKHLHTLFLYVRNVYSSNPVPNTPNYRALEHWIDIFRQLVNVFVSIVITTWFVFTMFPVLSYLVFRERIILLPMFLPLVDTDTVAGFTILAAYHFLIVQISSMGILASDLLMYIIILQIVPMAAIFRERTIAINDEIAKCRDLRQSQHLRACLRNAVELHKDMCRYVRSFCHIYRSSFFNETSADGLAMIFSVYVALILKWIPIYPLFCVLFVKLLAICLLGAVVETTADNILASINNIRFYALPVAMQRDVGLMVLQAQRPAILMSGPMKINLNLFVTIMKNVYTVGMILLESVE